MAGGETTYYIYMPNTHTPEKQQWLMLRAEIRIKLKEKQDWTGENCRGKENPGVVSTAEHNASQGKPQVNEPRKQLVLSVTHTPTLVAFCSGESFPRTASRFSSCRRCSMKSVLKTPDITHNARNAIILVYAPESATLYAK